MKLKIEKRERFQVNDSMETSIRYTTSSLMYLSLIFFMRTSHTRVPSKINL